MNRTTTNKLMFSVLAVAAMGLFTATQGCSSSSSGGTGGSTGAGGAGTGAGGSTGDAAATCTVPTSPAIADFGADGGTGIAMGQNPFTYTGTVTAPTATVSGGTLNITVDTGMPDGGNTYAGVGVPFPSCFNASSFTGVQFTASGTLNTGCTIQFSLVDETHSSSPPLGACTGTCYPGASVFTLPATATTVMVPFSSIGAGGPATPTVSPEVATGVQWQFNVGATGCSGSVTIDNITFY
jgi:hypothetical protein